MVFERDTRIGHSSSSFPVSKVRIYAAQSKLQYNMKCAAKIQLKSL